MPGSLQELPHRVVLDERDRQLDQVVEEEREDRAAAAGLRLERVGVRERAVVEHAEARHPLGVAVGDRRAPPDRLPLGEVLVDLGKRPLERLLVAPQLPVVMDAVQADLAAVGAQLLEEAVRDRVVLGDEVPRRDDPVRALHLADPLDVRDAVRALDVVGQHEREPVPAGPEVDERHALSAARADRVPERLLLVAHEQVLDGPARELPLGAALREPAAERDLNRPRQQRLHQVVGTREARDPLCRVALPEVVLRIEPVAVPHVDLSARIRAKLVHVPTTSRSGGKAPHQLVD